MKAKKSRLNFALCSVLAAAVLTLSACSTTQGPSLSGTQAFGNLTLNVSQYEELVNNSSDADLFNALILLTRSSINAGNAKQARAAINDLYSQATTPAKKAQAQIMDALLASRTGKNEKAEGILNSINPQDLNTPAAVYYFQLKSGVNSKLYNKTHDAKYQFAAYTSQKNLLDYVNDKDKVTVINRCNNILGTLPQADLASSLKNAQDYNDRGFLEYALISKSQSKELKDLALEKFTQKYSQHPLCVYILPKANPKAKNSDEVKFDGDSLEQRAEATPYNLDPQSLFIVDDNTKIAVLLPLSGRFADSVGNPAKLGILTALSDRKSNAKAVFYDTNKQNISEIVNIISKDGTTLIIGPILKPEVTALNNSGIKIPSIVLNTPEGNRPVNQWYFNLGPDYEGALAASKIYADGHRKPLVVSGSDSSSTRARSAFSATFAKAGKALSCTYQDPALIKNLSSACNFRNADSIYIHAPGIDTVSIKALIPSDIPVYLTDRSFQGINNSSQELALKGATLGDMPWLLTDSELKTSFMKSLPKANPQVQRIFATAYDSVNFAYSLKELSKDKNDVMHGLSGDLSLTNQGLIEASPMWVKLGNVRP